MRTDALRGKEIGIDCGSYRITRAALHAMRASIEFARARVLQASQRLTAVTPFAKTGGLVVPERGAVLRVWRYSVARRAQTRRNLERFGSARCPPRFGGVDRTVIGCLAGSPSAERMRDGLKRGDGTACSVHKTVLVFKRGYVKTERPTK